MADNIRLITYAEQTVTPMNDAILQDIEVGQNGIIYGVDISSSGNTILVTGGYGVVKGRLFQVNSSSIEIQLSSGSNLNGRLFVNLDLSNQSEPISLEAETASTLSPLTKEDDANFTNGIFQLELATFTVTTAEITNLKETCQRVHGGTKFITQEGTSMNDYISDGIYFFNSNSIPSDAPNGIDGYLIVISAFTTRLYIKQIWIRNGSSGIESGRMTQENIWVRTMTYESNVATWVSWFRLATENDCYYMTGEQVRLFMAGGGFLTNAKTDVRTLIPLCKPMHSSVNTITLVSSASDTITIRQNGSYLVEEVRASTLRPTFTKTANGIYLNLNKTSGFGGTNNDSVAILGNVTVRFS